MYRFVVESAEAAANGNVHLDTWIEKSIDAGVSWTRDVPNGHFTVVLNGPAILAITESAGTDNEKRIALADLFKAEVESRGIDEADDAHSQLEDLIVWPQTVAL